MKWFFSYNEDYKEITDVFFSSIKDKDCNLIPLKIKNFTNKWLMAGGQEGNHMRWNLINYALKETEKDELFLMCDTDIKFYKPITDLILSEIKNFDIIFQKEAIENGCNMGIMAMKNNEKVKTFWYHVYKNVFYNKNSWDQHIMNKLLYETNIASGIDLKWGRLSDCFWNWSMGKSGINFCDRVCLHHANYAIAKISKLRQFEYVEKCFKQGVQINYSTLW